MLCRCHLWFFLCCISGYVFHLVTQWLFPLILQISTKTFEILHHPGQVIAYTKVIFMEECLLVHLKTTAAIFLWLSVYHWYKLSSLVCQCNTCTWKRQALIREILSLLLNTLTLLVYSYNCYVLIVIMCIPLYFLHTQLKKKACDIDFIDASWLHLLLVHLMWIWPFSFASLALICCLTPHRLCIY